MTFVNLISKLLVVLLKKCSDYHWYHLYLTIDKDKRAAYHAHKARCADNMIEVLQGGN